VAIRDLAKSLLDKYSTRKQPSKIARADWSPEATKALNLAKKAKNRYYRFSNELDLVE
jgi:hypothetical protein